MSQTMISSLTHRPYVYKRRQNVNILNLGGVLLNNYPTNSLITCTDFLFPKKTNEPRWNP